MHADMRFARTGRTMFWLATLMLAISQIAGNGPDGVAGVVFAETVLVLLSIATIAINIALPLHGLRLSGADRLLAALLLGIMGLALIQLMPLPPALWKSLAGRSELSAEMQAIELTTGWRALSLSPIASERTLLALLPMIAMTLAARTFSAARSERLLQIVMALGILSALLGIAQVSQGPDSDLRLYRPSNLSDAVGFFANRNHYGSLLVMLLPFSLGWAIHELQGRREAGIGWTMRVLLPGCTTFLLVIGILLSHSRAGFLLALIAGAGGLLLLWKSGASGRAVLAVTACGIVAGLLALLIAGEDVVARLVALDVGSDTRWPVQATTVAAAHHYGAFGSGLGTFVNAYQGLAPAYQVDQNAYVNHANNDYLELWLEAGWLGAALIGGFFLWYALMMIPLWRGRRQPNKQLMIARAASVSVLLALIHAALEYQMRKPAIMVLFGFCCALMSVQPVQAVRSPEPSARRRSRATGRRGSGHREPAD